MLVNIELSFFVLRFVASLSLPQLGNPWGSGCLVVYPPSLLIILVFSLCIHLALRVVLHHSIWIDSSPLRGFLFIPLLVPEKMSI